MLTFAKILGKQDMPVFEILLARSSSILVIALCVCAKERVNPFGNRQDLDAHPMHSYCSGIILSERCQVQELLCPAQFDTNSRPSFSTETMSPASDDG